MRCPFLFTRYYVRSRRGNIFLENMTTIAMCAVCRYLFSIFIFFFLFLFFNRSLKKSRKVFGVEFAPLHIPWERRMETLSVALWIATFFLMGPLSLVFLIYLFLYTRFWFISVCYGAWFILDIDQCNKGGRR